MRRRAGGAQKFRLAPKARHCRTNSLVAGGTAQPSGEQCTYAFQGLSWGAGWAGNQGKEWELAVTQ